VCSRRCDLLVDRVPLAEELSNLLDLWVSHARIVPLVTALPAAQLARTTTLKALSEGLMSKIVSGNLPLVMTYEVSPWDALGDGTRRDIFERLVERPRAVGELAGELPVTRPAVSQHLRVLKAAGLVFDRAEGTRRVYAVNPDGLERLRGDLDRFWTQALTAFQSVAERSTKSERDKQKEMKKP
jgi:DNA-binding transcriptional ArsR family regulator